MVTGVVFLKEVKYLLFNFFIVRKMIIILLVVVLIKFLEYGVYIMKN